MQLCCVLTYASLAHETPNSFKPVCIPTTRKVPKRERTKIPSTQPLMHHPSSQQSSWGQFLASSSFSLSGFLGCQTVTVHSTIQRSMRLVFQNAIGKYGLCKTGNSLNKIYGIQAQTSSVGLGNSIFRSMRPGRSRAWSSISMRFVAIKTWIPRQSMLWANLLTCLLGVLCQ
jgi:hypothetical protein